MILKNNNALPTGRQGFSLLESLIAIFIITIGITAAVTLINSSISSVAISKSQIIATNLAQEGAETIRNIRDGNWIEQRISPGITWNDGLTGCSSGCRVQYNNNNILSLSDNPVLDIDSNGFYQYGTGTPTIFKRKITITDVSANEISVISEITWNERNRSFTVSVESRLFNWK